MARFEYVTIRKGCSYLLQAEFGCDFSFLSFSFRKTAKKMSHQFRDKPMPALNTTVFWLEYIFRHDGAPFLRPSVYRLAFYEYYCLDILAFLILSAGGILYVVYRLRLWYRRSDVNAADLNGNCLSGYNVDGKKVQ